jgi:hypothetical protein
MKEISVKLATLVLSVSVAATLVFSATRAIAADEKKAAGHERVFEMRKYYAAEGKLNDLNARFRHHTNALFEKHGISIVGFWVPMEGPEANKVLIYILAYPSRAAATKSWADFRADPAWKKAQADSEKNGKLVDKVESTFMKPTDYSPIH